MRDKESAENIINKKNLFGHTLLYIASRNGNLKLVKLLIEMGANINVRSSISNKSEEGNIAVAVRCTYNVRWGHCEIVSYFLESIQPPVEEIEKFIYLDSISAKMQCILTNYVKIHYRKGRCCKFSHFCRKLCCFK